MVVLPEGVRVPLPCAQLPELVLNAVNTIAVSILWHYSIGRSEQVLSNIWGVQASFADLKCRPGMIACRQQCCSCHCWCKLASALLQAHDSAAKQEEETAWEAERHESKYARTLEQLPATKKVCAPHFERGIKCIDETCPLHGDVDLHLLLRQPTVWRWIADGRHTRLVTLRINRRFG